MNVHEVFDHVPFIRLFRLTRARFRSRYDSHCWCEWESIFIVCRGGCLGIDKLSQVDGVRGRLSRGGRGAGRSGRCSRLVSVQLEIDFSG